TKSARFDVIGTLLHDLCKDTRMGFRVIQGGGSTIRFETYEAVDRTFQVRLSIENQGLAGIKTSTAAPTITRAILGGADEADGRALAEAVNEASREAELDWGRRIERFVNASGTTDPAEITK